MKSRWFFLVAIIVLLVLISVAGFFLPIVYVYHSGKSFIREIQDQTRHRAYEIGIALDTMSGESIYYDNFISLSNVMAKILEHSNRREDPFKITEIYLIDNQGKLLAHSDILKVAKDFRPGFDEEMFSLKNMRFSGSPIEIKVVEHAPLVMPENMGLEKILFFLPWKEFLENYIKKHNPHLLAKKFHLVSSVYPPDEVYPKATLHILMENRGIEKVVSLWIADLTRNIFIFLLVSVFLFFISLALVVIRIFFKPDGDDTGIKKEEEENTLSSGEENLPESVEDLDSIELEEITAEPLTPASPASPKIEKGDAHAGKVISFEEYTKSRQKPRDQMSALQNGNARDIIDALPLD